MREVYILYPIFIHQKKVAFSDANIRTAKHLKEAKETQKDDGKRIPMGYGNGVFVYAHGDSASLVVNILHGKDMLLFTNDAVTVVEMHVKKSSSHDHTGEISDSEERKR